VARASTRTASTGDMVRSLAVILLPVIAITYFFTRTPDGPTVRALEWTPVLTSARAEAPFPVLAPRAVPEAWRATQVVWVPQGRPYLNGDPSPRNLWELGFLDAGDTYVELVQGDLEVAALVEDKTREGLADGTSDVAGTTWERRVSEDERTRSLVRSDQDATAIVVGDLPYAELESFASTLATG
jgi:hypothetical protein